MLARKSRPASAPTGAGHAWAATTDGAPTRAELRLRVDWIRCDGYGLCGDLLPDLIDLDDWRYPVIPREPVDPARRHDVQRAVDCCPMKALFLESVRADARR
jgi:ferredoxin